MVPVPTACTMNYYYERKKSKEYKVASVVECIYNNQITKCFLFERSPKQIHCMAPHLGQSLDRIQCIDGSLAGEANRSIYYSLKSRYISIFYHMREYGTARWVVEF